LNYWPASPRSIGEIGSVTDLPTWTTASKLREGKETAELYARYSCYGYYYEAYGAVLSGLLGPYQVETASKEGESPEYQSKYGLKAFSPIAKGFWYSHCRDFGNARNYGFSRRHLGNDLMGSVGTPIIAVESGVVEALGWNQYGGWRIGIRSLDGEKLLVLFASA
jgi:murein DD-endopeptidase MepM/ murein hydrolase activator NlpD